jgi:4-amino-4-deoxy-L-arabinose transferase-like glycosyltransferase
MVMGFVYHGFLDPGRDHWEFGYELGHVARSIAQGNGFSSPYWTNTGATALLTPVYPYLLAAVFSLFGIFTKASALVILSINCVFSAITAVPVFYIGRKLFNLRTAKLAAWAWAFFPYSINFATTAMWYHCFVALQLATIVLVTLHLESSDRPVYWAGFGVLFGFAALTNPVILAILPFVGGWLYVRLHRQHKRALTACAVGLVALLLTVLPWPVRNELVMKHPIPFKDGFWEEVCVGNIRNNLHWWDGGVHPAGSQADRAQFERLGEIDYLAGKRTQAIEFIREHPGTYIFRSLRRVVFLWTGFWSLNPAYVHLEPFDLWSIGLLTPLSFLALLGLYSEFVTRWTRKYAVLFALILFSFPITYYLSHLDPGYRHPLDPLLILLACSTITRWITRRGDKFDKLES